MLKTILSYVFPDFSCSFISGLFAGLGGASLLKGLGGSLLGGMGSGLLGGLFGGNSSTKLLNQMNHVTMQNAAGNPMGNAQAQTSIPPVKSIPATMAHNAGSFVKDMAGKFLDKSANMFVSNKVNEMFGKTPGQLGRDHKKFNDSAFPGTNPWEQLGSAAGAGSGGAAQANIEQQKHRQEMEKAQLTTQPAIDEVKLKMQKLNPEIEQIKSSTGLIDQQKQNMEIINRFQPQLSRMTNELKHMQGLEHGAGFRLKTAQMMKTQRETLNAMQQNDILRSNAKIQASLAQWAELLAAGKVGAPLIGVLSGLSYLLGRMGKTAIKGSKTTTGLKKN